MLSVSSLFTSFVASPGPAPCNISRASAAPAHSDHTQPFQYAVKAQKAVGGRINFLGYKSYTTDWRRRVLSASIWVQTGPAQIQKFKPQTSKGFLPATTPNSPKVDVKSLRSNRKS